MILVQRVENVMRVLASIGWKMKGKVEISESRPWSIVYLYLRVFVQLQFIAKRYIDPFKWNIFEQ